MSVLIYLRESQSQQCSHWVKTHFLMFLKVVIWAHLHPIYGALENTHVTLAKVMIDEQAFLLILK